MERLFTIEEINEIKGLLEIYKNSYDLVDGKYVYSQNIPFLLKRYFEHENGTKDLFVALGSKPKKTVATDEEYDEMLKILEENIGEVSDDEWLLS